MESQSHRRLMEEVLSDNPDRRGALLRFVEQLSEREVAALRRVVDAANPHRVNS